MDHLAFQGHALEFYQPQGDVYWPAQEIVSFRLNEAGIPYGIPFVGFNGENDSNLVPRLEARFKELRKPMPTNLTLVGSAFRALVVGGAEIACADWVWHDMTHMFYCYNPTKKDKQM